MPGPSLIPSKSESSERVKISTFLLFHSSLVPGKIATCLHLSEFTEAHQSRATAAAGEPLRQPPHISPGAKGGGGWPMHAAAQPWHAQGRPLSHEAVRTADQDAALWHQDLRLCRRSFRGVLLAAHLSGSPRRAWLKAVSRRDRHGLAVLAQVISARGIRRITLPGWRLDSSVLRTDRPSA